jgi:hypothetical protein
VDIQEVLADPSNILTQPVLSEESRTKFRTMIPWLAATLILGAVIAGVIVWKLREPEPPRIMKNTYQLPDGQKINFSPNSTVGHNLAISPDGKRFVYSTNEGLYLKNENELEAQPIKGTESNPQSPFFSPNGQYVGYWSQSDGKLKKILITGGMSETLL